jgi:inner membrane transporter RhtA
LGALAAGGLSSAVPFLADLLALRRAPAHFFGIFMSVNPVFAALVGVIVLGQYFDLASGLAIAVIVTANAGSVRARARPPDER